MTDTFLSKENTDVLWEVLIDDESVPKTKTTQETFVRMLPRIHEKYKTTRDNLMDMNKIFMQEVMVELENAKSPPDHQKNPLITYEDIQSDRSSAFEKELKQKEEEFTSIMSRPVPEEPDFKDTEKDPPLGDVSDIIKRMMEERNLELSNIQKTHNVKEAEKWITSTNPSITSEREAETKQAIKYIKIEKDALNMEVPSVNLGEDTKHVTWGENMSIDVSELKSEPISETPVQIPMHDVPKKSSTSIFSKLKTTDTENDNANTMQRARDDMNMVPSLTNQDISSVAITDIQRLYDYVHERFDRLEKLMMEKNTTGNM